MEKTTVALRMPNELRDRIKNLARRERRTLTGQIVYLLEAGLAESTPAPASATFRPSESGGYGAPDPASGV